MFNTITIKGKEYKMKLSTGAMIELEKALGENPLNVFMKLGDGGVPKFGDMALILFHAMKNYNHGLTLNKLYELLDDYMEEGNTFENILNVILEVLSNSNFFKMGN